MIDTSQRRRLFFLAWAMTGSLLVIAHAKWDIPYVLGIVWGFWGGYIKQRR